MTKKRRNKKWEIIGCDYNSPLLRNYIWVESLFWQAKYYRIPRVVIGLISRNNNIEYITDLKTWNEAHEVLKKRVKRDYHFYSRVIQKTMDQGETMNIWATKNIQQVDLTKKNNEHLIKLMRIFFKYQCMQYAHGVILAILDFADYSFLEDYLKKLLKNKAPKKKFDDYYAVFTKPNHNSFAMDQEIAILRLMQPFFWDKKWARNIIDKNIDYLYKNYSSFYNKLKRHTKRFAWVYYVYNGPAFTERDFLEFFRDYLLKKINPTKKLLELKKEMAKTKLMKVKMLKKLKLTAKEKAMVELVGRVILAKPRRKDYQSKLYWQVNKLCQEISRRLYISVDQVKAIPVDKLEDWLVNGKKVNLRLVNEINKFHICIPTETEDVTLLYSERARQWVKKNVKQPSKSKSLLHTTKVSGVTAFVGMKKGVVKIVNKVADIDKMDEGNILISTATTPSIVTAMKKAAAIVTDEGGLTCHASIVSRELKIPCVIGTKIATQVFKDGDRVEVDASNGVVRKI